jgi:two-component system, OmpR family, sensor histidine kinase RstB
MNRAWSGRLFRPLFAVWWAGVALLVGLPLAVHSWRTGAPDLPTIALSVGLAAWVLASLHRALEPVRAELAALADTSQRLGAGELEARVSLREGAPLFVVGNAFDAMADRVASLISGQQDLLRAVSHELRTPLARLRMSLELARTVDEGEAQDRRLAGMDDDLVVLDALVAELLQYARLQKGAPPLVFDRVDLRAIAKQVADDCASDAVRVDVTGVSSLVDGEPRQLQRAVLNLVRNAVRHAKSQVRVTLSDQPGRATVLVEDDGEGVAQEHWSSVFDPFVRLEESRARDRGGSGLGLSIVKRIARWHDGDVAVDRSDLGGARFTLSVSIQPPESRGSIPAMRID